MNRIVLGLVFGLTAHVLMAQNAGQTVAHVRQGVVSDWTSHHVLYPEPKDDSARARMAAVAGRDPRWLENWYRRHREAWWPGYHRRGHVPSRRDWSRPLEAAPIVGFGPIFDFTFDISPEIGYGSLNAIDMGGNTFLATAGGLNITGGSDIGTYPLYPGGPGATTSPLGSFSYDDVVSPSVAPPLDEDGLLFTAPGFEINIWGNSPGNYSFYDSTGAGNYGLQLTENGSFTLDIAPGGGQTFPAKYTFDLNAAPSCTNDYVAIGIPAALQVENQGNIVGVNNLYSGSPGALCPSGPTVMFAYISGTGQVPAPLTPSQDGTQLAYIENLPTGSSYFHYLLLGTTGTNGSSPTEAVVPGAAGGNNAVDHSVLLSPDGGVTNQSSTNAPWVNYTAGDLTDVAYATTYSAVSGTGYLYKIANVFNGAAPTIVWSLPIDAIPSTPIYDTVSQNIFFTDSNGRIDYVTDNGAPPVVVYGAVLASGNTAENPVVLDTINEMIYATFNSNGTDALLVQAPTSMASSVSVPVGPANTLYDGPYEPDFNNAWYTGSGTPLLYIAGTGAGGVPTLYSVGFNASGVLNSSADPTTAALTTGPADSSPVSEYYNATIGEDFLFVGVTNNCVATDEGGSAGCVMGLDITNGFPIVNANSTALSAAGGTTGIVMDNDSNAVEASSIYYATKTGANLVKATQAGLN